MHWGVWRADFYCSHVFFNTLNVFLSGKLLSRATSLNKKLGKRAKNWKKTLQGSKNSRATWLLLWHKRVIYGFHLQSCYSSDILLHRNSGWIIQIIKMLLCPQLQVCGKMLFIEVLHWKYRRMGFVFAIYCFIFFSKLMEIWGYSKIGAFPQISRNLDFFFFLFFNCLAKIELNFHDQFLKEFHSDLFFLWD